MVQLLTFVTTCGCRIAQRVVDNLAENLHQFVGFLNHGIELRRSFGFFQRDAVLGDEVVVAGRAVGLFGIGTNRSTGIEDLVRSLRAMGPRVCRNCVSRTMSQANRSSLS